MGRFLVGVLTGLFVCVVGGAVVLLQALGGSPARIPPQSSAPVPRGPAGMGPGQTWLADVHLTSGTVVTGEGGLRSVRATGHDVRLGPTGLTAGSLEVLALLPYRTAAHQIGDQVRLYPVGRDRVGITRVVQALGRRLPVSANGVVHADGGQLAISPENVQLGSGTFLDSGLSTLARDLVTIHQQITGLPQGLALRRVQVTPGGFRVRLSGHDVRIAHKLG